MKDPSIQPDKEVKLSHEILTVDEVAVYLRVSRITIWRWCQQGIIPASRIGRTWRIHRGDLIDFLKISKVQSDLPK
jgi:excisionase family DNA binding protein